MNIPTLTTMTAYSIGSGARLNTAEELEATLRQIGASRYHNLHPFHRLLHGGKLNKGQVQAGHSTAIITRARFRRRTQW